MPYKSDEERKLWDRERKRKQTEGRKVGVESVGVESPNGVESVGVEFLPVIPSVTDRIPLDPAWEPVRAYLVQPSRVGDMTHLERLQRVAGSLGKLSGEVRFGIEGPTMQEVGDVIGAQGALYGR